MSVTVKILPKLVGDRTASLERYSERLFEDKGASVMVVGELVHAGRYEPSPDGATKPYVNLAIAGLLVAPPGAAERTLREIERALFLTADAQGSLVSGDEVKLAEQTIELAAGVVAGEELARMRVTLDWLLGHVGQILDHPKHRAEDLRRLVGEALVKATAARDTGVQLEVGAR